MAQLVGIDDILLSFLLLQIYIVGRSSGVCCHMMGNSKLLETLQNVEKRAAHTSALTASLCYDANKTHHLRLWNGRAPGAVGDNSCKDIPFLKVFTPSKAAPRTDVGIILMAGGGYHRLTVFKEQAPVARYFADTLGITTFILYYRRAQKDGIYRYPVPMWDGQRALRYVRSNAAKFNINPNHIGIFGFSAGGHLGATIALHPDQNFGLPNQDNLDKTNARTAFLGLGYPVISMSPQKFAASFARTYLLRGYTGNKLIKLQNLLSAEKNVGPKTPPTFIFASLDDKRISSQNSLLFIKVLKKARISHEPHMFKHGRHGSGLAQNEPEQHVWPGLFGKWLVKMKFISRS